MMTEETLSTEPSVCPAGYAPILADADEIAAYIASIASDDDVDEEMIGEYFRGCRAALREVALASLREGPGDANIRSATKERRYGGLSSSTMPPIVVEDGEIMDGHHRYRAALRQQRASVWAYVVVNAESSSEAPVDSAG